MEYIDEVVAYRQCVVTVDCKLQVELFDRCGEHLADDYKLMDVFYIFRSEPVRNFHRTALVEVLSL